MIQAIQIHKDDNVATVVQPAAPGDAVQVTGAGETRTIAAAEAIPQGHKIALAAITAGEHVIKYGEVIGRATAAIVVGACVHSHNMEGLRGRKGDAS